MDQPAQFSHPAATIQAPVSEQCHFFCPACGGQLHELRNALRCVRCYLTICEGCGGGIAVESSEGY